MWAAAVLASVLHRIGMRSSSRRRQADRCDRAPGCPACVGLVGLSVASPGSGAVATKNVAVGIKGADTVGPTVTIGYTFEPGKGGAAAVRPVADALFTSCSIPSDAPTDNCIRPCETIDA